MGLCQLSPLRPVLRTVRFQDDTSSCDSVGTNPVHGDISSLVQVTPLQQCEASSLNVDCFNCDVAWLASGSCMPGVYAYQYTLTNSDGYSAVPVTVTVQIYEQGQLVGSILFASNTTTAAAAATAAASLATNSSAYNLLMTQPATTALNAWMTSDTSAAVLSSTSYAGLAVPTAFTYTLLNVTPVAVINATEANLTVEILLNITSSSLHYAMDVWLNVTVQVGYSVALNSSVTTGRRLLLSGWASADAHAQLAPGSSALALPGGSAVPARKTCCQSRC
ncbi:hypothetical protein WJX77_004058 [Trebouxia sp. C0004]